MVKTLEVALGAVIVAAASAGQAHAYLDPGTGSLILQAAIGGIAGGLFILRTWWSRIASFLPGRKKADEAAKPDSAP
jgi:hypothetical protein